MQGRCLRQRAYYIPFRITSEILKSLMFDSVEHFMGGSLIMQLEPAQKLFSKKVFNPYIVFYHTFFLLLLYVGGERLYDKNSYHRIGAEYFGLFCIECDEIISIPCRTAP